MIGTRNLLEDILEFWNSILGDSETKSILDILEDCDMMSEAILGICGQIAAEKFINREKEEAAYYISGRALV